MALKLLAIHLGKQAFHIYSIDTDGVILSRKVSRAKLAEVVGDLGPTAIATMRRLKASSTTAR